MISEAERREFIAKRRPMTVEELNEAREVLCKYVEPETSVAYHFTLLLLEVERVQALAVREALVAKVVEAAGEVLKRRERACEGNPFGSPDGSDGRYARLRDALRALAASPSAGSAPYSAPVDAPADEPTDWEVRPGSFDVRASCPRHPFVPMRRCGEIARCSECGDAVVICDDIRGWKHCVREKGHAGLHVSPSGTSWPNRAPVDDARGGKEGA